MATVTAQLEPVLAGRAPQLALGVSLRALPSYKELPDLRGRRVGVSSVGSSTHLAATLLLYAAYRRFAKAELSLG